MIIKSIFRRYERWNPVHPTSGAFWGMGIGIGCGIGWGPGFGPEVVGYVGAGCGAGFNVGFTLLGIGIGLPANAIYTIPYGAAAFVATKIGELDGHLRGNRNVAEGGWGANRSYISDLQQNIGASFPVFKIGSFAGNIKDLPDVNSMLVSHAKHMTDSLQRVSWGFFSRGRGSKS